MKKEMLTFRLLEKRDLLKRVEIMNNPLVYNTMHYSIPITIERTLQWFEDNKNNDTRRDFVLENNGEIVAMNGLTGRDSVINKVETYSFVDPLQQGKGFGSIALLLQAGYAFDRWDIQKIWCFSDEDNIASHTIHRKVGFVKEGELRREVMKNGCFISRFYFGMLRDDFRRDLYDNLFTSLNISLMS